ncbi:MAG: flagellar motor protein MotB [Blastopirellula sp.]|nr:MAG: flagellar motor protein MotB [Blastopirellula sp.]
MNEEEEEIGIPEWVVTFGDMMSLLLTFFIMLVSLSELKQDEPTQAMIESFRRQFGHEDYMGDVDAGKSNPQNSHFAKLATMGRSKRFDTHSGGDKVKAPTGDSPQVRIIRPGSKTAVGTVINFLEGEATLTDANKKDLKVQANEFAGKPQKIEVRGHTSLRPVAEMSQFKDHSELAFYRCKNVENYLVSLGIDRERIRIAVAGKREPLYAGTDPIKLQQNSRVDLFLLDEVVDDLKGARASSESPKSVLENP